MEEQRRGILEQILEVPARDRLIRLGLTRAEKARAVEDQLIRAATSGQLRSKVAQMTLLFQYWMEIHYVYGQSVVGF